MEKSRTGETWHPALRAAYGRWRMLRQEFAFGFGTGVRILVFSKFRFIAALAAVAVAVVVMLVQLGLLWGILDSQALVASLVRGELIVISSARTNLHKWNDFDRVRLAQIASIEGVARVLPVYESNAGLYDPVRHAVRRIVVFAVPPDDVPLNIGDPAAMADQLRIPNTILFDRLSRPIYAPVVPGTTVQLDSGFFQVGGFVDIGPDIVNDGAVVMSEGTLLAHDPGAEPIMGVIRLDPGADPMAVRSRLRAQLPADVAVFTPDEVSSREIAFTLSAVPIGILFGLGVLAGLVVGSVTCYQILFNGIMDHLAQYATLKAMGFSHRFLQRIILEQALLIALGGFAMGLHISALLYAYLAERTALPIHLGAGRSIFVLILATGMCTVAGLLAVRRVAATDPAELY